MPAMLNALQMLDRCHLEMRHRVLDLASALDRVQSAPGDDVPADDSRMATLLGNACTHSNKGRRLMGSSTRRGVTQRLRFGHRLPG